MQPDKPIEWQKIKQGFLGFRGDRLLCIVETVEDLPVEGWSPNYLRDVFMTPEAAMQWAEKEIVIGELHRAKDDAPPKPSITSMYLPLLKAAVQYIEATTAPTVERTGSEHAAKPNEADQK